MRMSVRQILIGISVFFCAMQASAQYSVTMPFEKIAVQNNNGDALFQGGIVMGQPGQPALPSYEVTFLLPPYADLNDVTMEIQNLSEQEQAGQYIVTPGEILPSYKNPNIVNGKDTSVYNKNAFFPAGNLGATTCGSIRQYKIATVTVDACRYNPVTKKLRVIKGGTLSVRFGTGAKGSFALQTLGRDSRSEALLGARVVNPSEFEKYGTLPAQGSVVTGQAMSADGAVQALVSPMATGIPGNRYLVITTPYIAMNCPALSTFLSSVVTAKGGTAQVLTIDDQGWSGLMGDDRANAIRDYLRANYVSQKISNLLIIGSPDIGCGDIPMIMHSGSPTDFYYADMDEPVTGTGDIAVGRIPAAYYDTYPGMRPFNMEEINEILTRTTAYCLTSGAAAEWRRMSMLPIVPLGVTFGPNYKTFGEETIIPKIKSNSAGWEFFRLYDPYDFYQNNSGVFLNSVPNMNPLPEAPYCNPYNVPDKWNDRKPGLVVYNTHGCPSHGINLLGTDDRGYYLNGDQIVLFPGSVTYLSRNYPAVVFAASCWTAPPEIGFAEYEGTGIFTNHLAYQTLNHNAVAYIGATREIIQSDNTSVSSKFVEYMTKRTTNTSVGEALNLSKSGTGDGTILFNVWGCPNVSFNLTDYSTTLGVPQGFNATPGTASDPKTQVKITWTAVTGATSYVIEKGNANATRASGFAFLREVTGTNTTETGLAGSTKYKYRMYAKTSTARSPYSIIDSATTYDASNQPLRPNTPTSLAVSRGDCGAQLSWSPASSGPGATSFNIHRSASSSGTFTTIANVPMTMFTDTNLVNGKTYYYKVSGVNNYGQSGLTGALSVSPVSPGDGNVAGPTLFEVYPNDAPAHQTIYFHWINSAYNYLGSLIEYTAKLPDGSYGSSWTSIPRAVRNDRSVNNPPLGKNFELSRETYCDGNTNYRFRIRHFTHPGSDSTVYHYSQPKIVDVKTKNDAAQFNPNAPTWVTGSCGQVEGERIRLTWNYTAIDPNEVSYKIHYKIGSGSWQEETYVTTNPYSVYVGRNKTVDFYIRAYHNDLSINSDYSAKITLSTNNQVGLPRDVQAYTRWAKNVQLNWTNGSSSTAQVVIDRQIGPGSWTNGYKTVSANNNFLDDFGLTPGTQYSYRMRTLDNSVYSGYSPTVSATTFSATAQSVTSPYDANKAIDGDENTDASRWAASTTSLPQWWQLNMVNPYLVTGVSIKWRIAGSSTTGTWRYKIEASSNLTSWTTVLDSTARTDYSQYSYDNFQFAVACRYLKITVTGGVNGVKAGFYEFQPFIQP
jgi:hypothetical protein